MNWEKAIVKWARAWEKSQGKDEWRQDTKRNGVKRQRDKGK